MASPIVITIMSPSCTSPRRINSSSAACRTSEENWDSILNEIGCTPLNRVTLLNVDSVGVNAKMGTPTFIRDIHRVVDPDCVNALNDVGGIKALKTLATAAKSNDPQLQDAGSRLLGKWNGLEAAPVLLDLAKTAPEEKYQLRALRGYIGLARKFAMPDEQRAEMCRTAFDMSRLPADQKQVLDVLKLHPSIENLKLAIKARQVAEVKDDATQAMLVIAQKLGGKGDEVKELLVKAGFDKVKLEIVKAEYGAGASQKDVTDVIQKQASDLPLITLASSSYNASFGGDPAQGSVKKLKIQYKINGKAGEASFDEDALIILPMPK